MPTRRAALGLIAAAGRRMKVRVVAVTFCVLLCAAWACAAQAVSGKGAATEPVSPVYSADVYRRPDGVHFEGFISSQTVRKALKLLRPHDTLWISSGGGSRSAGLALGEAVFRRSVAVRVRNHCESACALYVFLPAKRKSVAYPGVVLFHDPVVMWEKVINDDPVRFTPYLKQKVLRWAREERELYKKAGISLS